MRFDIGDDPARSARGSCYWSTKTLASAQRAENNQHTPSCLCVSHVRKVLTHASAVSQNVPAQIPSTTGTCSDIDCTRYQISYFELFRQPYSKELMANNGLGHPPITPSTVALTAAVNQETVRAVTGHKGGRRAGGRAGSVHRKPSVGCSSAVGRQANTRHVCLVLKLTLLYDQPWFQVFLFFIVSWFFNAANLWLSQLIPSVRRWVSIFTKRVSPAGGRES